MVKKYEVEQMVKNAVLELDGLIDDKPNPDGTYDMYEVKTEDVESGILVEFTTIIGGDFENKEHDKYRITIEYCR